ncbi:MAG TPA: AbrB family transcriptional regulator [Bauldia sp.]|nr:AbrB family transcriptional regulator [Bauldia sp.]
MKPPSLVLTARTLAVAAAGGGLATLAGLPASWLTGAMLVTAAASIGGWDTRLPRLLFAVAMVFIGTTLGVGATPDVVARAGSWPVSVLLLLASIVAVQVAVQFFLVRGMGWDRMTAFFAAIPGAMSYVLVTAAEAGADLRRVAVGQSTRVFLLVALLPPAITAVEPHALAVFTPLVAGWGEQAAMLAAGTAGGLLFHFLRVPAGLLSGSLIASAVLHGTGLVAGTLPGPVVIAIFITLGAFVGSRFVGTSFAFLRQVGLAALASFVIALGLAGAFALLSATLTGVSLPETMVAFAPGGLDSMTSLALALHMDLAFVSVHQLARFIGVALVTPIIVRLMRRKR